MFINNALRDEIGALNASKGWHDEPRSIAQHCILLHSEVSEIVEDYRNNKAIDEVWYEYEYKGKIIKANRFKSIVVTDNGFERKVFKPCGIPSELADVVIRALDMAYEYEWGIVESELEYMKDKFSTDEEFAKDIHSMHFSISYNVYDDGEYGIHTILALCIMFAKKHNINLEQQIRDKIEYNRTRPIKHGGKRL